MDRMTRTTSVTSISSALSTSSARCKASANWRWARPCRAWTSPSMAFSRATSRIVCPARAHYIFESDPEGMWAEILRALDEAIERAFLVGAVDAPVVLLDRRVEGREHDVGARELLAHLVHPEKGAVRDDGEGKTRDALGSLDERPHAAVERRLAGARKGDDVGSLGGAREPPLDLVEDLARVEELFPAARLVRRRPAFAVDAVERAGFIGDDVDAERETEPPRGHGAEDALHAGARAFL